MADFNTWKNTVLGVGLDIDKAFGRQCVDVPLSWGQACFPGLHWSVIFPPVPAAKDMFDHANETYFEKIENDHTNVNQLPQAGDIAVFAGSPEEGYSSTYDNSDGHVGVVDHADSQFIYLVQQDSSEPAPIITQLTRRPWRYTRCIGWLRPKLQVAVAPAPSTGDGRIGKTLYIHGIKAKSVVRVGAEPVAKNIIGWLLPANYKLGPHGQPGLQYVIQGVSRYPDTVTIKTDSYGLVDVYLDKDCEIL